MSRLLFGVFPVGNIPGKNDDIFKGLLNGFGIADDTFIVGYEADGRDHNKTLR